MESLAVRRAVVIGLYIVGLALLGYLVWRMSTGRAAEASLVIAVAALLLAPTTLLLTPSADQAAELNRLVAEIRDAAIDKGEMHTGQSRDGCRRVAGLAALFALVALTVRRRRRAH